MVLKITISALQGGDLHARFRQSIPGAGKHLRRIPGFVSRLDNPCVTEQDAGSQESRFPSPSGRMTNVPAVNLREHGLSVADVHHNLPPSALYDQAIRYEKRATIAENGALVA